MEGGPAIKLFERKAVINILLVWSISVIFILIKGNLLHSSLTKGIDIDLVIIFTVFLLASGESSPGIFVFCQGFLLDILSGGVIGLHTFLYLIVYCIIRLLSHPVDLFSPAGRTSVIFIAVMAKELLLVLLLNLFSLHNDFSLDSLYKFCISSIITSIISIFILHFFKITPSEIPRGGKDEEK
ncbi:MAG: rod shape-determining protein MreD [Deltaproteobacteria bacterium]|nr:rod shape-determining protein MreD [Deltaproteobacteria bacterium]